MTRLRALSITMSVDGFMAGPNQSLEHPMGIGTRSLHEWYFSCAAGRAMMGMEPDPTLQTGVDDRFIQAGIEGIGATIMGRNMFGPIRGEWPDESWTGWWGDEPPYHHPVFVLTHHPRPPLEMIGTTFHFVTDGIESALEQATAAADGADIRLGGGASTIRQYMQAGLLDELHVVVSPILVGGGERVFEGPTDMHCIEFVASERVAHFRFVR
ncbi:MAG: bifunctional deaminase-reductase domain protein [Ilumatobacteraceae bacterium]|nr:bifunctional deaminase-reductase domain protein [Ilumatobacteraceae bacterium]